LTTPRKATPDDWKAVELNAKIVPACSCILELRDRIAALEAAHQQPEPISEEENDRRFRDCMAAIDNYRQDHLRDVTEMVATDDALMRHYSQAVTDAIQRGATNDELSQAGRRVVYELGRQHGAANSSAALASSNHPAKLDSSLALADGLVALVAKAICGAGDCVIDAPGEWQPEARAAILAVADWLDNHEFCGFAEKWLREEVQRHD